MLNCRIVKKNWMIMLYNFGFLMWLIYDFIDIKRVYY